MAAGPQLVALLLAEGGFHLFAEVVEDVPQLAVAPLPQDVAPVKPVGPQLGVVERQHDGPDGGHPQQVHAAQEGQHQDDAVHDEVRPQLLAETDHRRGFPARSAVYLNSFVRDR